MSAVCYTLEEAAQRLKLTETVLVRLSNYFKVPKAAYEETGYLSFKGDLLFNEYEIAFFNQIRQCLLQGDNLQTLKKQADTSLSAALSATSFTSERMTESNAARGPFTSFLKTPQVSSQFGPPLEASSGLLEIKTTKPYEKAASDGFERYKSLHHPVPKTPVFASILKATTSAEGGIIAGNKGATSFASKPKEWLKKIDLQRERLIPFLRMDAPAGYEPSGIEQNGFNMAPQESTLETLVSHAVEQPRALNEHLKTAAALIRQQATGKPKGHFPS